MKEKQKLDLILPKDLADFNAGTATWKGVMLMHMTRTELYHAMNELGKLYRENILNKNL